jgi:hypothetical protein
MRVAQAVCLTTDLLADLANIIVEYTLVSGRYAT